MKGTSKSDAIKGIAFNMQKYMNLESGEWVMVTHGKTLGDELWYRVGSSIEESEKYDEKHIAMVKKNFMNMVKMMEKDFTVEGKKYIKK